MKALETSASRLLCLLLLGCSGPNEATETYEPAREPLTRASELSVMTFNIFYGGDELDLTTGEFCEVSDGCQETFTHVVDAIRTAGPDVVGVQEPERNTVRLAEALGWYADERNHVISRFPIIDPPGGDGIFVFVEVAKGRVAAVANVHLPSDPYGPYLVRDGGRRNELEALERSVRLPAIERQVRVLPRLAAQGVPVILTGDFNSPSHLDWTRAVARVRPEVKYPFVWPVSKALADAGLRDTYRAVHPNPVATPGFTWTPGGPESDAHEVHDRIDWVLTGGPITPLESAIVGETAGPNVDIELSPYPSDHRGVVSRLGLRAAPMPVLVAVSQRRLLAGDSLSVRFHALDDRARDVVLARDGRAEATRGTGSRQDGTIAFETRGLRPGAYEAKLVERGRTLAMIPFWLYPPNTEPSVAVEARRYGVGQPIDVSWRAAPGRRFDWLAVFRCDAGSCAENSDYLVYRYIDAAIEGHATIGADAQDGAETWPLPAGRYVVRLLTDDSYEDVATSRTFTIE
ncbi:MAG: endonuclease/exonuclease/phosphatase family protein [Polyangiaceae bacterium]